MTPEIDGDLHEGTGQRLMALALELSASGQLRAAAQVRAAAADLRDLAGASYPPVLIESGLDAGLEELVERHPAIVQLQGAVGRRLPRQVELVAYRTAERGLTSAMADAGSSTIVLAVHAEPRKLVVTVTNSSNGAVLASEIPI